MPKYWENFFESLWSPESWFKVVFLLAFLPLWWPTVKAMLREIIGSIKADGENTRHLPPGEDPFLNVPLASHRSGGGGRTGRSELRPVPRRAAGDGAGGGRRRHPGFAPTRR